MSNKNNNKKKFSGFYVILYIRRVYSVIMGLVILAGIIVVTMFCIGIRPYAVISGSMEPAVHVGSICMVDMNYPYSDIKERDIISLRNGELFVTHRVVKITKEGMITKGDANNAQDPGFVTVDSYFGKTLFSVPYVGYAVIFFKSKWGKVFGIGAILLLLLLDYMLDMALDMVRRDIKRLPEEKSVCDGDKNEEEQKS